MSVTFQQFFGAIAGQESGGNYSAVNSGTGALGKYQIMPGNVAPWAKQYLGANITASQFLRSPSLQDRLAGAVLKSYYNQYGARGAAAAWYSGSASKANDYNSQSGGPSIGAYCDQVLARAGQSGGGMYNPDADGSGATDPISNISQPTTNVTDIYGQDGGEPVGLGLPGENAVGLGLASVDPVAAQEQSLSQLPTLTMPQQAQYGSDSGADAGLLAGLGGGRAQAIAKAQSLLGLRYTWGGDSRASGMDCSGYTQTCLAAAGIDAVHYSGSQALMGQHVAGSQVTKQLRPGDLVCWQNDGHVYHVAMYAGNGEIYQEPQPGGHAELVKLWGDNYFGVNMDRYYGN